MPNERYSCMHVCPGVVHVMDSNHNGSIAACVVRRTIGDDKGWRLVSRSSARGNGRRLHDTPEEAISSMRYMSLARARDQLSSEGQAGVVSGPGTVMATHPLLVTHDGAFHLDDVFAFVTIRLALGLEDRSRGFTLVRTRDPAVIARADIAWDVGAVHDDGAMRFDHHQNGRTLREDGIPYSSAGLVWRVFGTRAVGALLQGAGAATVMEVAHLLDHGLVRHIDMVDNGLVPSVDLVSLFGIVEDMLPPWDGDVSDCMHDSAFARAAVTVHSFLSGRVGTLRAQLAARDEVRMHHAQGDDPRILELPKGMPWQEVVHADGLPVLYAVYPAGKDWMVAAMPSEPGSYEQRLPLPAPWAGLRDADLARESGVPDAVFVHAMRFVGAAHSLEGARLMASKAMGHGLSPSGVPAFP